MKTNIIILSIDANTVCENLVTRNERIIVQNSGTDNNYIILANYEFDEILIDGNYMIRGKSII